MYGNKKKELIFSVAVSVIGIVLYVIFAQFVFVPLGIYDGKIAFEFGIVGFAAAIAGPLPGATTALFGELIWGIINKSFWVSDLIALFFLGCIIGLCCKDIGVKRGYFGLRSFVTYIVFCAAGSILCWCLLRPVFDVLIYKFADVGAVFGLGFRSAVISLIGTAGVGSVLCFIASFIAGRIGR